MLSYSVVSCTPRHDTTGLENKLCTYIRDVTLAYRSHASSISKTEVFTLVFLLIPFLL